MTVRNTDTIWAEAHDNAQGDRGTMVYLVAEQLLNAEARLRTVEASLAATDQRAIDNSYAAFDAEKRARTAEARVEALSEDNELLRSGQTTLIEQCDSLAARVEALEAASLLAASNLDWLIGFLGVGEPASVEYLELALTKAKAARAVLAVSGNQPQ